MRGNFFYRRLGEKILFGRKKHKFSQEELAFLSNIDRTYLSRIEKGKANPSIKTLHKICRELKIKLSELLKGL